MRSVGRQLYLATEVTFSPSPMSYGAGWSLNGAFRRRRSSTGVLSVELL